MPDDLSTSTVDETALMEVGYVGVRRAGGMIVDEYQAELIGLRGIATYREMGNDPVISAMLLAYSLLVRQVTWQMTPADDSALARQIADHCESCMTDLTSVTWESTLSDIMTFMQYGWAVHEIVLKRRDGQNPKPLIGKDGKIRPAPKSKYSDGKIGLSVIESRAQDTLLDWAYDDDTLVGMKQADPVTGATVTLPLGKICHFRTTSARGNPEGRSLLRGAYEPWYYKRRAQQIEIMGADRDLVGLPVAYAPDTLFRPNATAAEVALLARIKETVRKVRRDTTEGLVWPTRRDENGNRLYEIELLKSGGSRQFDIGALVTRYDQRILISALADFLLLGHEGVSGLGVTSIGATKVDLTTAALQAFVNAIAAEINEKVWPLVVRLNGWPPELSPTWEPGMVQAIDLAEIATFVKTLADAGFPVAPDAGLQEHLYRLGDLPFDADAVEAATEAQAEALAAAQAATEAANAAATGEREDAPAPPPPAGDDDEPQE